MFKRTKVLSGREARRYGERERKREQRQADVDRFWALSPERRAQIIEDNDRLKSIQKNGITLDDLKRAEDDGYQRGVQTGIESTMQTCYAAICLALHELHGFGKERCAKVLNSVDEKITMSLTSEETIREVYDTMGLEIVFKGLPGERIEEVG